MNIDFTLMIRADDVASRATAQAREAARKALVASIEATTDAITGTVPLAEKLSWASKEEAARGVLGGTAVAPPIIAGEAFVTGETVLDLSRRIVRNADAYRGAAAAMTGLRRKAEAGLDAAVSLDQIAAVVAGAEAGLAQIIAHARGA